MADLFEPESNSNVQTVKFDDLVGEGKKYSDPDTLASSYAHAESFIEQLKREAEEMRTELQSRLTVEEALEKLQIPSNDQRNVQQPQVQEPGSPEPKPEAPSSEDLREQMLNLLKEEKSKDQRDANLNTAREGLKERFGPDYNQKLVSIAEELSVSKEFLTSMAQTSPQGFLRMVDSVAKPDDNRPAAPPRSSVDTSKGGLNQPKAKNNAYYRELKRTDPKTYFSRKVQSEMHNEAVRQGPAFYQ